jgi:hypothetical protein
LSPWKFDLVIPFLSKLQYLSIPHHLSKRSFDGLPARLTGVENHRNHRKETGGLKRGKVVHPMP